ncbi:MAG: type II toxin-antitoxin system prevent-host-death family antitoxin [Mobiluncus porci]|uniref:type II toxin-antitoxin system prevent-host-death family antitoxin n=1 Tax=Mobiluncus TaxID=2050 RepID=UPI0023EF65FB|nr:MULTISPECIES: type II toxin-antitoxin system prevent-host-death family antitoxin [Mobiluncus]MCI6585002.1 type II toxin-antitoxin system prevent-host-death family antitoxin [Mobiluncus sp.]MDD7542142.1 type II toxin-antitoxin system prevent-host-death family antitoxin [Mobiluncus porci]MDY5749001.1 type II toxin-antitoxin system prevent-host-death family antitoxin [Mobiluncus porci]
MNAIAAAELNETATKGADDGPLMITSGGKPAYVLLSINDYKEMRRAEADAFLERMRMDEDFEVDFSPQTRNLP